MRNLIESAINTQAIIQSCIVRVTREKVGKFVSYQCSHKELELVEMAVENIMGRTDRTLQPVASVPQFIIGEWHSTVSFYANAEDVPAPYVPLNGSLQ